MYVITGASGHTGERAALKLLEAGKEVIVIGRSADRLAGLVAKGARAAIGDLSDAAFLTQTFKGATGVYALIPPNFGAADFRAYQNTLATALTTAIREAAVPYVVTLSSIGAHSPETGVVGGLYDFEQKLAAEVPNASVLHLRAGFFMQNFLGNIGLIKGMGINGGFPINGDIKTPIVHTNDIGDAVAKHLLALDFKGHSHVYAAGAEDLTMVEATTILGNAIGKPELPWVTFSYEDAYNGMLQVGIGASVAEGYIQFSRATNDGILLSDYARKAEYTTPTTLADFAKTEFAPAFEG
ncbi:MAG: NmrA family NAD(P)-binding protein [Saprospiraceae bacterium]|nr:NmrA family NAD(P)-binding protein [Saprospiraceae bacterium]